METWIWVLIPLAAIIGSYMYQYKKLKLRHNKLPHTKADVENMQNQMTELQTRIENIETIVADLDMPTIAQKTENTPNEQKQNIATKKNKTQKNDIN